MGRTKLMHLLKNMESFGRRNKWHEIVGLGNNEMKDSMKSSMKIGVIGLGTMGGPIAYKLRAMDAHLVVFDINQLVRDTFKNNGFMVANTIAELSAQSEIVWIMVPAPAVDDVLKHLCPCTKPNTLIIDGGNSHYIDTVRRAQELHQRDILFLDCGTSGGIWGTQHGFSMTIGGNYEAYKKAEPLFKLLAESPTAYCYTGPSGSGHYVKMVHNGIEYALLEAYAEGLRLLHEGAYKNLDLAAITHVWLEGAIIRSFILQLAHEVLSKDQSLDDITGAVGETGTGRWTVEEAHARNIPVRLIEDALAIREESRKTGGNYATKLVAMMRHIMGGHPVTFAECEACKIVR